MTPRSAWGRLAPAQRRQALTITVAALALFGLVRVLPTGTNLSHMDFRVTGKNVIEFCDPLNPQFLPVVAVRSPVTMTVGAANGARFGEDVDGVLTLTTFSGKPIAPEDLQVVQTKRIHLLIVDPSLDDYQHVHPVPARTPGQWTFRFHPRYGGRYRLFADFTPVATNRGLYAETDLQVQGPANPTKAGDQRLSFVAVSNAHLFQLLPSSVPVRAGVPETFTLSIKAHQGPVRIEPIMGAFAHLVAFDTARSGFAHIHPDQTDLSKAPDALNPRFTFRVTIPTPGRYVIWSQAELGGTETYAPFWFDVAPRP